MLYLGDMGLEKQNRGRVGYRISRTQFNEIGENLSSE